MALSRSKKSDILAKLADAFAEASAVAFVGFTRITVHDASRLRRELANAGVRYFVAKKTLIKKALAERGYAGAQPELPGEIAVAWTTGDVLAPARGVYQEGARMKGALALLGGVFEGAFADAAKMAALATIPPLSVLRGMFVNIINSPRQGLVIALDKIRERKAA